MDLLLDIGNTRIKWAMCDAGVLHGAGAIEHGKGVTGVNAMLDAIEQAPVGIMAANVAGDRFGALVGGAVQERWDLPVRFAVTQPQAGSVRNGYEDYRQLGIDRWLAIIAAANQFAGSICIVDAGTAVTIDTISSAGLHHGGYIIPGLDLMRQSLSKQTGDLGRFVDDVQQPEIGLSNHGAPGHGTAAAINDGTLAAVCSLVNHCVSEAGEDGNPPTLVMTGGDAERLIPHLEAGARHQPQLVLEGLAIYQFEVLPEKAGN